MMKTKDLIELLARTESDLLSLLSNVPRDSVAYQSVYNAVQAISDAGFEIESYDIVAKNQLKLIEA